MDSNNNAHFYGPPFMEALQHGDACELQPVYQQGGSICVPLTRVWYSPKVRALCGSVQRLREELLEDERVRMSADGTVVNLPADDEEEVEEEKEEEEDIKTVSSVSKSVEEDWDRELGGYGDV